jgi:hypothetical protein
VNFVDACLVIRNYYSTTTTKPGEHQIFKQGTLPRLLPARRVAKENFAPPLSFKPEWGSVYGRGNGVSGEVPQVATGMNGRREACAAQGPTGISLPTKAGGPDGLPSGDPPGGSTVTA